jgi:hypothetical protein
LFLFDRRAVRFFRKDGHNWQARVQTNAALFALPACRLGLECARSLERPAAAQKKKDNKTVKETHEKLKARAAQTPRRFSHASLNTSVAVPSRWARWTC